MIPPPETLREFRRAYAGRSRPRLPLRRRSSTARRLRFVAPPSLTEVWEIRRKGRIIRSHGAEAATRRLDSLISRYGPHARLADVLDAEQARQAGEARPKDTDEVAPASSGESDSVHGGDGNSQEVQSQSKTSSSDAADQAAPEHGDEPRPGEPGGDAGEQSPGVGTTDGEGQASSDQGRAEQSGPDTGSEVTGSDAPARDAREEAGESDLDGIGEPGNTDAAPAGEDASSLAGQPRRDAIDCVSEEGQGQGPGGSPSSRPCSSFGGRYAAEREVKAAMARLDKRHVADVRRALDRLIRASEVGAGQERSPRWDHREMVKRLASHQGGLHRARREELERPLVIIAPDVSGSCSACCAETMAAAMAIALYDERVLVVEHSNGLPCSTFSRERGRVHLPGDGWIADWPAWKQLLSGRRVGAVVALGDWDAGNVYKEFCNSGAEFYWLDSYCRRDGPRPASHSLRSGCSEWKRQPAGHWQGVGDVASTAIAMRAMARRANERIRFRARM